MVLRHLRRHSAALRRAGFTFGASRLAVVTAPNRADRCRYCGLCLYGCPYHSIYNASHTLDALVRDRKIDYRAGVYVDRLAVDGDSVTLHVHERGNAAARSELSAARVFVACGALSTTRLMLESMGHSGRACRLLDSQYFVVPMLSARATAVTVATQGNTLAQAFLELEDERVSRHATHLQLYGYNDIMLAVLAARLPVRAQRLERVLAPLLRRLIVAQGYLHSHDSPGITLALDAGRVRLTGDEPIAGANRVRRVVRRLAANTRQLGMVPVPALAQPGRPGKGNHVGGSFPMRRRPSVSETDTLGCLPRWERVHLVDASVLPSIPSTTVTLSVMANAHRIASAVAATGR